MQDVDLNWLAIVVAALVPVVLGALWYSPALFARQWMRASGRAEIDPSGAPPGYALSVLAALVLSYVTARVVRWAEVDDLANGAAVGLLLWLGLVALITAVQTYFTGRPRALWLIDASYWLIAIVVIGAIHGAWD